MANLNKYTSTEALNISYASDFEIQSAWSISSTEVTLDVSGFHTIFLQTDEDIYYGFSDNTNAILGTSANNIYLKGGDTIYQLAVPYSLGDGSGEIYIHAIRKTSSDATARIVFT